MRFFPFALITALLHSTGQADLIGPGDLGFTGFNADGDDDFAFVTLVDINPNSSVFFSDRNWDGTSFGSGEDTIEWNSGLAPIAAGSVVSFSDTDTLGGIAVNLGSVVSGRAVLSASGDSLWAYLGSDADTPTAFLSVITNNPGSETLSGTGLTAGSTAQWFSGSEDIMAYTGPRSGASVFSDYRTLLSNFANWATQDDSGDQSTDGNNPDVPFDTTGFTISGGAGVPEPSSLAACSLLAAGLLTTRLRRNKNPSA